MTKKREARERSRASQKREQSQQSPIGGSTLRVDKLDGRGKREEALDKGRHKGREIEINGPEGRLVEIKRGRNKAGYALESSTLQEHGAELATDSSPWTRISKRPSSSY